MKKGNLFSAIKQAWRKPLVKERVRKIIPSKNLDKYNPTVKYEKVYKNPSVWARGNQVTSAIKVAFSPIRKFYTKYDKDGVKNLLTEKRIKKVDWGKVGATGGLIGIGGAYYGVNKQLNKDKSQSKIMDKVREWWKS